MKGSGLVDHVQSSPNIEPRFNDAKVALIVLHYTGMASGPAAVDYLCNPISKVSCHYLVDVDGTIVQMVDESKRAWHAGVSHWFGQIDINSCSIGIEIQNPGHGAGSPAFPDAQMQRVAALCVDLMQRYHLRPDQVVAHSDIAPGRKVDPGEAFDWMFLASHGIGQCVVGTASHDAALLVEGDQGAAVGDLRRDLAMLGYGIGYSEDFDKQTRVVVEALQRRYRRQRVDGRVDAETLEIIRRLVAIAPTVPTV